MYRKGQPKTIESLFDESFRRIKDLEEIATKRVLPKGYRFQENSVGQLIVVNEDTGTATVIL